MLSLLKKVAVDVSPLRESRDFRLIALSGLLSGLGTQAALVALPYQIFVLSHSAALVGLLGAFELGPMIVVSLLAGAIADRTDRRRLLAAAQVAVIAAAGALALAAAVGTPPVLVVLILGGLLAGGASLDGVARGAIVPNVLPADRLRTGLAFSYGIYQVTGIVGPALGGLLIAVSGVTAAYVVDAVSCTGMLAAALAIAPQRPHASQAAQSVGAAIIEGLRFVKSNNALSGSFAIDLVAMTFGMPRALFAVLALTVYHAGAGGAGLLYSAVALGGTLAVVTSGWIGHARRLGRIVIGAVLAWGAAIAAAGLVRTIAPAIVLLAAAGYADGVSARVPLDDQPDGHARRAPRPDERRFQPRRDERTAVRRHRVGPRRRRDERDDLGPHRWARVCRARRRGRVGVSCARRLRRARAPRSRRAGAQRAVTDGFRCRTRNSV